jgi:NTE family protein
VIRAGKLREALRATISLPGILPPVVEEPNRLLVDGAVLNNFPVDVMRESHRGPIIGVDVARRSSIDINDYRDPPSFMSWIGLHGLQTPPPVASLLMRAATIQLDPWQGRDGADLLIVPEMAEVDLRDWKLFDEAVSAGYEAAVVALKSQPLFGRPDAARARRALDLAE